MPEGNIRLKTMLKVANCAYRKSKRKPGLEDVLEVIDGHVLFDLAGAILACPDVNVFKGAMPHLSLTYAALTPFFKKHKTPTPASKFPLTHCSLPETIRKLK